MSTYFFSIPVNINRKTTPERLKKVETHLERLFRSPLADLGRLFLKVLRWIWPDQPLPLETVPKVKPVHPSGPFLPNRPHQRGDLLIFVPRSLDSRFIDDFTGGYGYSHVIIDCGESDLPSGEPVMIESTLNQTVEHEFLNRYGQRPFVRIPLSKIGVDVDRFCSCIHSKLGQPYDIVEALTLGTIDDPARQVCSNLATNCLPEEMRRDIARKHHLGVLPRNSVSLHSKISSQQLRVFISPNAFAEYFGAPRGKTIQAPDQAVTPHLVGDRPVPWLRRQSWGMVLLLVALAGFWLWRRYQKRSRTT